MFQHYKIYVGYDIPQYVWNKQTVETTLYFLTPCSKREPLKIHEK